MVYALPSEQELLRTGITIVETIVRWGNLPRRDLVKQLSIAKFDYKDPNNIARTLDSTAHNYAVLTLRAAFENIFIYGEEAQTPKSLTRTRACVAIFDAVDGTDLWARGFSNWCSAIVFMHPRERRIIAAAVGHSSGEIYYASSKGAFKKFRGKIRPLKRSSEEELGTDQASICFYGQKPASFLRNSKALSATLREFEARMSKGAKLFFRLYNFGGNPMMVKIPDCTVDAVFETKGQSAHDVIPGAYIATQAGSVLIDLRGNPIDLATALLSPHEKLTYILAATHGLAMDLKNRLARSR